MRTRFACLALAGLALVARPAAAQDNPFSACGPDDNVQSNGKQIKPIPERPNAYRSTLTGDVVIPCGDTTLMADEVVFEDDTHLMHATGNVLFQQADLRLFAARGEIDARTKFGTFYDAVGEARLGGPNEKSLFGTVETDVRFEAKRVEKTGPATYRISDGRFTTCMQATPRWQMTGSSGTIALDKYALLKNMVLKVKGVPLLYLPAIYYPINKEGRSTGFLLPTYGASTVLGPTFSNAFFLVLGRSQDATFYHDWYSRGGQGLGTEYRYASAPGSEGRANVLLVNTPSRPSSDGTTIASRRVYRIDGSANQLLGRGFRLFGNVNLFTDAATQQLYQDVNDSSRRDQSISGTLTGAIGRYRLLALAEQRDTYFGSTTAQRSGRAPFGSVTVGQKPIGRSRVYLGGWAEGGRIVRQNDTNDAATNRTLWRIDASPTLVAPLSNLPYLDARGTVSWRLTQWSESLDPVTGDQVPVAVTRQLVEMRADVRGPKLTRVFQTPGNSYAERFKHVIEPSLNIRFMTPFDGFDRVAKNDPGIDAIVGGDVQLAYGLANRLLARRTGGGAIREILSVSVSQTYYTKALAANADSQYQSTNPSLQAPISAFSPIRVEATTRPVDSGSANFRMEIDPTYRAVRQMDANATMHATRVQLTAGWSKRNIILGLPGFEAGGNHSLNAGTTIRTRDNRLGGSYQFNYDVRRGALLYQRILTYYNSQCCGVAFDWGSRAAPLAGFPTNHNWTVSFTLAGIGTFSNPLGSLGGR